MHRSRFSTLLVDVPGGEAPAAVTFWSEALGAAARPVAGEEQFTALEGALPELVMLSQILSPPPAAGTAHLTAGSA